MIRSQRAGDRLGIITVQRATITQNNYGDSVFSWSDVAEIRAGVDTPVSAESVQDSKILAKTEFVFRFHVSEVPDLGYTDRIFYNGYSCEIDSILRDDSRQEYYVVRCNALVDYQELYAQIYALSGDQIYSLTGDPIYARAN